MSDAVSRLSRIGPDARRAERVRARCHGLLDTRRVSIDRARRRASLWKRVLAPALVGGFCIIYICVVFVNALG